jgi:hypothetical protein
MRRNAGALQGYGQIDSLVLFARHFTRACLFLVTRILLFTLPTDFFRSGLLDRRDEWYPGQFIRRDLPQASLQVGFIQAA